MGNLYAYFTAQDDVAAAAFETGTEAAGLPTVDGKGIDPYVCVGNVQALLVGSTYEDVIAQPRFGQLVNAVSEEGPWVSTLTDQLRDALADAAPERLAQVAGSWSRTEEFNGHAAPAVLAGFLDRLADLARRARQRDHGLYCWVSL